MTSTGASACTIATVAGSALGVAAFVETTATRRFEPLVLATGVTVLSAALLFRAWHRGMREVDFITGRFADAHIKTLTDAELGEFETGILARVLGPVGAAILGGTGSLVVTVLWSQMFPSLRKADRLDGTDIKQATPST